MRTALHEHQYALRRLRNTPGFTIAATLTLAIAIGATASVFSVVDGVLLKSTGIRDPRHLLVISQTNPKRHITQWGTSPANYLDWQAQSTTFSGLAAASVWGVTVTGTQEPERLRDLGVTANWFSVLGLAPALGRTFASDSGGPAEVLISYGYWQRKFGGERSVLGRTLMLDGKPYTIVGVMEAEYLGVTDEVWTRLSFTAEELALRRARYLYVYGRLKAGVTQAAAQSEMETIAGRLAQAYPQANENWSVAMVPAEDQVVGPVRPPLIMMLAAAGCVLLIGAANLANLFLVRCAGREREMAIRTAIGATRNRLMRELFAEAMALGLIAGALGVGVAVMGVRGLRALAPQTLPRLAQVGVDGRVVAFCALASVATVLIFGLLPAWYTSRGNVADFLKEGGRATGSAQRYRLQDGLVVLQVAVALVLLTGAGLLVESFNHFRHVDPGFRPDGVVTAHIDLPDPDHATPERRAAFVMSVVERLATQPGIAAASASDAQPGGGNNRISFTIIGDPTLDPANVPIADAVAVSPDYFRTMGIKLLRGRVFLPTDDGRAAKVGVIDELLARRFFGSRDPLGRRVAFSEISDTLEIVGVVATIKETGLTAEDRPAIYAPFSQFPFTYAEVAVRTAATVGATTRLIKGVVAGLDPTVPVSNVETMSERMVQAMGTTRFSSFLASLFALVALILGAVGIYSVLAYIVSQRRREIAVRIALGASKSRVMGDVLRRASVLAGLGIALGSAAAWILTRVLAGLFLGVSPHDPSIFVGAAGVFAVVALIAAGVPAFRTTRINPVVALTST